MARVDISRGSLPNASTIHLPNSSSHDLANDLEKQSSASTIPRQEPENQDGSQLPLFRKILIFLSLALAMLLASLDTTIVATIIPRVSQQFDALSSATWITTAYMLTSTALQPLYGSLSNTFGRVPMILTSLVIFFGGSAACGWAPSMGVLIFGRALQGVGGSGLIALVFIVISDVTTEKERPMFMGVLGAVWSIASVIGPVLGGVFTDKATWRWSFFINLPASGVVLIIVLLFLRLPQPSGSLMEKLKKVDFLGSLVLIGGTVMLLLALTWGGKSYPWRSAKIICLLVFGIVSLVVFMLIEWKTTADPTVPIRLFRNRNVSLSVIGQFFMGITLFIPIFYIPIWYTIVKNASAISSGLHLLPYLLSLSLVSILSGFIVTKTGRYRLLVIFGTAILVVGAGLTILFDENLSQGKQIGFMILMGAGAGFNVQILLIIVQTAAEIKDMASATTLFLFTRLLGGSIGIAVMQSIFQNTVLPKLIQLGSQYPEYSNTFIRSFDDQSLIYNSGLPSDIRAELIHVYVVGLKMIFIATVPFAAAGLALTLPLKHIPLRGDAKPSIGE
ncbi:hypothetical protein GGI25_004654 [Coemansia spiralis]|uniref:Major facilitator superfamily (MFS) profile domain-containing protein n=2 Tax=Coemansia TaxID=4863 RepID=A0A9W8G4Q2_9FUNG|nr:major facilitator superfamily-domain-containing protein [Coemansia spiralis]KAJ1989610.1 hypothetical protein EDC05_004576 [Coemansia umbellata]KAJ2620581.1 hypothetical protein GGI26_004870 [Coemansia sp. RSA 1358]KAJ2673599.1 hypothetical protein GGI25_004654 [Coemansia spiralis]